MNGKSYDLVALSLLLLTVLVDGFSTQLGPLSSLHQLSRCPSPFREEAIVLMAEGKKKRRRRKDPPGSAVPEPEVPPLSPGAQTIDQTFDLEEDIDPEDIDVDELAEIANFKFDGPG